MGWLYTHTNDTEIVWTYKELHWCKKWKTQKGAANNFDHFNSRWQFKSRGGYLKIEVMPEFEEPETAASRKQKLLEEWGGYIIQETKTFEFKLIKGLPEEHGTYLFLLESGDIKEGYFGSFPHPNHEKDIRVANFDSGELYYTNCVGWLKK